MPMGSQSATHSLLGQPEGISITFPSRTYGMTCSLVKPTYGCAASVAISYSNIPYDLQHTSAAMGSHNIRTGSLVSLTDGDFILWKVDFLPDIRFGGADAVAERFWCHPPDRQHGLAAFPVILAVVDVTTHPKVANLHRHVLRHHTVPGGQIPVHKLLVCQIRHPISDLRCHLQDLFQGWRLSTVVILQKTPTVTEPTHKSP